MNQITRFVTDPETDKAERSPVHSALDLTRGGNTARIVLDNKVYQLRITKLGKLILTK